MRRSSAKSDDPGQYLPLLAQGFADRFRAPREPLSRSAALAAAPWDASMPPARERQFREAFADRLEMRGLAKPARRGGSSGASLTDAEWAERGVGSIKARLPKSALSKLERDAKRVGCSRAKLLETLIVEFATPMYLVFSAPIVGSSADFGGGLSDLNAIVRTEAEARELAKSLSLTAEDGGRSVGWYDVLDPETLAVTRGETYGPGR